MDYSEDRQGNGAVITIGGRLDATSCTAFQDKFIAALDSGVTRAVVELSKLDYISSAGLRVFLMAAKKLKAANGALALAAPQPQIKEIFDIAGFSAICPLFATVEEARKSAGC